MENKTSDLQESKEIAIRLEQYDDIFSDFDIRPYSARALSVDFLDEMKRAASDKRNDGIDLTLFVPHTQRDEATESVIRERLTAHFGRHYNLLTKEKRSVLGLGITMVILGIISMICATFILSEDPTENLLMSFLLVFLEPAAWFLLWEGMDQIIFNSKNINPDLNFYKKMYTSNGKIDFRTY